MGKSPSAGRRCLSLAFGGGWGALPTSFALPLPFGLGLGSFRFGQHRGVMAEDTVGSVLAHALSMCEAGLILVRNGTRGTRVASACLLEAIFLDLVRSGRAMCVLAVFAKFAVAEKGKELAGDFKGDDVIALGGGTSR